MMEINYIVLSRWPSDKQKTLYPPKEKWAVSENGRKSDIM